jgi:hypothetical protein
MNMDDHETKSNKSGGCHSHNSSDYISSKTDDLQQSFLPLKYRKNHFKKSGWKWVMLFLSSAFIMGNYFCYEIPAAIQDTLEKDLRITQT